MAHSQRLEIRLSGDEYALVQAEAARRGASMGKIVREALWETYGMQDQRRQDAADRLFAVDAPVSEWEQMKREITEGRLK